MRSLWHAITALHGSQASVLDLLSFPMAFRTLIDSATLANLLAQDPSVVVVDCRFELSNPPAGRRPMKTAHIPGAVRPPRP